MKNIYQTVLKMLPVLLVVAGFVLVPEFAAAAGSRVYVVVEQPALEDFEKAFREGRDLIDKEEWAKAAAKFSEVIDKYPDNKSADAALYWLAFCYKKQKMFKETDAALDRLLEKFPSSSWASDARVMKLEIAAPLGRWVVAEGGTPTVVGSGVYTTTTGSVPGVAAVRGATNVTPAPSGSGVFAPYVGMTGMTPQTPLDREDEIRIAAFQSLLSADSKKGIEALTEILKSGSKASETLKIEVLRVVRRPHFGGFYAGRGLTTTAPVAITVEKPDKNDKRDDYLPMLREALVKSYQNESNVKLRKEIIYTLAASRDEQSINYLARLYESENSPEVKKAIINGFGSTWGSGNLFTARAGSGQNTTILAPGAVTLANSPQFAKLLDIVRAENDLELRALALTNLQRFGGWETSAESVELLAKIYDSESSEDLKKTIIQGLGRLKQPAASKKLLEIAKNDKSDKLRIEAIYALRHSNTPEALEYLQELVK